MMYLFCTGILVFYERVTRYLEVESYGAIWPDSHHIIATIYSHSNYGWVFFSLV